MRVRVLVFGVLKEMIPASSASLELPEGARVREVIEHYRKTFADSEDLWQSVAAAVNREYVGAEHGLREGDEVALLPPVSGGSIDSAARDAAPRVSIVRERIDAQAMVTGLERPEDGALVVFDGMVRNNTRGRRTLYLIYEAYEEMALEQMRGLAVKAISDFAIRDVAMMHRLGRIDVGESSVLIAVSSAHRAAAFEACRWLIDTLKKTVPIWKKEFFEDGAVWADGEPWPDAEISA